MLCKHEESENKSRKNQLTVLKQVAFEEQNQEVRGLSRAFLLLSNVHFL